MDGRPDGFGQREADTLKAYGQARLDEFRAWLKSVRAGAARELDGVLHNAELILA